MITSAKTIQKKNKQKNGQTECKSKVIQTKSHKEGYTYTLTKREKGNLYIYIYIKKGREQPNQ